MQRIAPSDLLHSPAAAWEQGRMAADPGRGGSGAGEGGPGDMMGERLQALVRGRDHSTQSLHSNSACETMETFSRKIEQCTAIEVMQSVQLG